MAKGRLSEDTINFIMTAETSQLQEEVHKSGKVIDELRKKEIDLRKEQAAVKSVLGEESKEYKDLSVKIKKVTQEIADENLKLTELHKKLGTNSMTMAQLRKEAKQLQKQLDNTSQTLEPKAYETYAQKLREVQERMKELKDTANGLKLDGDKGGLKGFFSNFDFKAIKNLVAGNIMTKGIALLADAAKDALVNFGKLVSESLAVARAVEGVAHAFSQIDKPGLLKNLRAATHGTVTDIELMKAAVQANDFRIPLDQLGKYLEFAQLKAQQTGQSVDYMTNSIVTGLGRKSLMILDNLGLSAAQIKEEMAGGADMATAVGRIIDQQLAEQGEHFETAAERAERSATDVSNAQLQLGQAVQKTFGIGRDSLDTLTNKVKVFILNGLTKLVLYCQSLYDKLGTVRLAVESVKIAFDTAFKAIEICFLWIIDAIKLTAREIRALGGMIEGVFTLDLDKVKQSWGNLKIGIMKSINEFAKDGNKVGTQWGKNVIESINSVLGKKKIEQPQTNEIKGIEVTGTKKDRAYWEKQVQELTTAYENTKKGSQEAVDALNKLKEAEAKLAQYNTRKTDIQNDKKEQRDADQQTLDNFKRARQAELDAETAFFSERERQYKESLARQEITRQQYDTAMTAEQTAHAKRVLDIEKDYSKQSAQLQLTDAKKKKEIVADQQRNAEKAEQQYLNQLTKIYEQGQQAMQQLTDQGMTPQEREQRNRELQLQVLRGYYESALMMAQQYGQDEQAVTEAYLKARMRLLQQQVEAEQQRRQKEATERQRTREQLGVEQQTEYEQRHQQLVEALEKGYVTQEEYADREKQLKMDSWKEQFDYYAQLFGGAINALQDAEMANVDAKYDAEIEAARKAGKDTTELENKKAEEKLEIQKKYADVNFAVKASQIIADTAASIMKTLAELGPIAGPVAAALMGITGAAQLAAANAERQKVKNMTLGGASSSSTQAGGARVATGRAKGGYVDVEREQDGRRFHARMEPGRRGYVDRPTVIVGEGPRSKEWVASNDAVENPTVRPFIDVLDRMQRSGQVRTFDLRKYLQQEQTRGLAAGGSVNVSQTKDSTPTVTGSDTVTKRLADVLERIERDGIAAIVGVDQVEASQKQRDRARKIGSKQ